MLFCKNCGQQNKKDTGFCTNCGQALQDESVPISHSAPPPAAQPAPAPTPKKPRKPMGLLQKILLSAAGLVAIAAIITHLFLSNHYDPANKIEAMNEAYNNQDKEAFFRAFHFKKGTVADAPNFYAAINEHGWTNLRRELTEEVEKIKRKEHTDIIYNEGEFISLHKNPILFGLYHDVTFTVIPTEVWIQAPYAGMAFTFDGNEVVSGQEDEEMYIGDYIPGTYEWSYLYKDGVMPVAGKGSTVIRNNYDNSVLVDVDWNFTSIAVASDVEDAIVYVGGKSTGKTVSELDVLFPAQINPDLEIFAVSKDKDGNEVKSDILQLSSDSIYLPFEHFRQEQRLTERKEQVQDVYRQFRSDFSTAIYYADFRYIDDYFEDGSKIKKDYAKFVVDHNEIPGYSYDFLLNDITSVEAVSADEYVLRSLETFNFSSNTDGALHYERTKEYVFTYRGDEIFIEKITDLDTKKTKY